MVISPVIPFEHICGSVEVLWGWPIKCSRVERYIGVVCVNCCDVFQAAQAIWIAYHFTLLIAVRKLLAAFSQVAAPILASTP